MSVLHLVSCVRRKLDRAAPARELYCSQWFRMARAVVEQEHEPWAILSAKHGLLLPDDVVEPYDETLVGQRKSERRLWAKRVMKSIPAAQTYILWAGNLYAEYLAEELRAERPMRGLGIGQQLAYLKRRLDAS